MDALAKAIELWESYNLSGEDSHVGMMRELHACAAIAQAEAATRQAAAMGRIVYLLEKVVDIDGETIRVSTYAQ